MNDRRSEEQPPVELLVFHLARRAIPRAGARVDDAVGDFAVAFAIELEVLAAAGVGDLRERRAVERRANRRGRRRRVARVARRFRDAAAHGRADADDEDGNVCARARGAATRATSPLHAWPSDTSTNAFAFGDLPYSSSSFSIEPHAPGDARARCWCPRSCRLRDGTATRDSR